MKKLSLLGSTGSIGTQALQVVQNLREQGEKWEVAALAARSSVNRLEEQARKFHPEVVAVFDEGAALSLRQSLRDTDIQVLSGMEGLCEAAAWPGADLTLNAVVGMVGLQPTLAALQAGKALALANKETLVAGGAIVMEAARKRNLPILPVDSEHSAIFQCLQGCPERGALKKLVLTASGGPFFGRSRQELAGVTREQALRHPNWDMGAKITIDSATMMNKGLEVMEASWLFDLPEHRIEVVVHRESVIHSMVEYQDNAAVAQLGVPDMAVPIQYALTYPRRMPSPAGELDLCALGKLTFYPPDREAFPCLELCREALRRGGLVPAAANGANEQAVALFLEGKIGFLDIPRLVEAAMDRQDPGVVTLEAVLEADREARAFVAGAAH
ncbi:1-deoxy-D-xylulose-5-phosphate reductoisomerase [Acutalibacter sp. LFL-21]|uniref:1-deoxy-D-xylulose-5-phosphate reductoisomerase n=1 Tax=Acutalibacter sp. LFL-21 TaxID=2983399 RepID=UPI0021D69DA1|nr:1-deoxy-D-xylulose-5-phosphate reductoisomerase [Acutalibacter sp. LFL-21]MCU7653563.1 1-deoxy-D-xylulose-5-phosphate reductoisomerase [Acutalibacter sp. LFL-21]